MKKPILIKHIKIRQICGISLWSFLAFSFCVAAEENFIHDRIEVTGRAPAYQESLSNVLPQQQIIEYTSFSSDNLATLFAQTPAINLNGQGGLFQTINIRGFARWRIQTLVEGIPIYSERRAGSSAEFLPPAFLGQAYLTQGAASTQLGSGAIGGGIDLRLLQPRVLQPQEHKITLNHGLNQDYREVSFQGSFSLKELSSLQGQSPSQNKNNSKSKNVNPSTADEFSWQLNHRHANSSKDGNNEVIQDSFEHNSLVLRHSSKESVIPDALLLISTANNIAKANADNPEDRTTLYPENTHILGKLTLDWHNATFYFHDSKLHTVVTRPGRRINEIQNDSLDVGMQLHDQIEFHDWQIHWRTGIDGRTGVKAFETEVNNNDIEVVARLNLHAEQWEYSLAADVSRAFDSHDLAGGIRLAHQIQKDKSQKLQAQKDRNLSAFLSYGYQLNDNWKWSTYLSNAYRVPSLTERFFNGSTPRGIVLGNVSLLTETATNVESRLSYAKDEISASISIFQQEIDHYIERLIGTAETDNQELRQYRNLDRAEISGFNYQIKYEFDPDFLLGKNLFWDDLHWVVSAGGQWLNGEDQNGFSIADISPAQHNVTLSFFADNADGFITLTHRQSSSDIVSGELPTESVTTLDAGYNIQLNDKTKLSLNITNLTDKHYVTSRDDLAPFAKGLDMHFSIGIRF